MLLEHAVARVVAAGCVDLVVAVVPLAMVGAAEGLLPDDVVVVAGGHTRQASVSGGLDAVDAAWGPSTAHDVVLVHDAARCLAPPALVATVAEAVRAGHSVVVPAVAVHDTVRMMDGSASAVVDRSRLRAVQTPQGFERAVLARAHAAPAAASTDDAMLAEALGYRVHVVPGAEEAFKVTGPMDLTLAAALLASQVRA